MTPLIVIYDGECGICNALRRWAEQRDAANRLQFAPNQTADLDALAPGLTREMASRAVYAVRSDGQRWYGARAIFETLRRLKGVWGVVGSVGAVPVISWIAEPFYRVVAFHRARISRWMGLDVCRIELPRE
jgi:predicted DCC family thiol-disulfide oxidoreductase YuxK